MTTSKQEDTGKKAKEPTNFGDSIKGSADSVKENIGIVLPQTLCLMAADALKVVSETWVAELKISRALMGLGHQTLVGTAELLSNTVDGLVSASNKAREARQAEGRKAAS